MAGAFLVTFLSALAPLAARLAEVTLALPPCTLCLWQRAPYWVGFALAFVALLGFGRRWLLIGAGLCAALSAAIAAFHLGVEFGWWPSPLAGCQVAAINPNLSLDEMMATLAPRPTKPCDEPAYLLPGFPLSMAGMNLIYGAGLAALAFTFARKEHR